MKTSTFLLLPLLSFSLLCCGQQDIILEPYDQDQKMDIDEYSSYDSDNEEQDVLTQEESAIADYEQHVCDHITIKPPKSQSISALLTNFGCTLLIHYITLTEKAKICMARLKNIIAKLISSHS